MLKIKGVIVCDLLIICQREFRHEFRRDYARAIASAGLRDVDSHWLYEDENENLQQGCRVKATDSCGESAIGTVKASLTRLKPLRGGESATHG